MVSGTLKLLAVTILLTAGALTVTPTVFGDESGHISPQIVTALTRRADSGDSAAQFQLAIYALAGRLGDAGRMRTVEWLEASAAAKNNGASFVLGTLYARGVLVRRDTARAAGLFRGAAGRGDVKAMNGLALLTLRGDGVERDVSAAAKLFAAAAKSGLAEAKANLGILMVRGEGVPREEKRGAALIRDAASRGVVDAQFNYGVLLESGTGVEKNSLEARNWFTRAAEKGSQRAQFALVRMILANEPTAADRVSALKWLIIVGRGGDPSLREQARNAASTLTATMSKADIRQAVDSVKVGAPRRDTAANASR